MNDEMISVFEEELFEKIQKYDLKSYRKEQRTLGNIKWLKKNIDKKNGDKKDIERVKFLLEFLEKKKK